jgi:hypothetical protein
MTEAHQPPDLALEMEVWASVAELTKPLYGHHTIPALIADLNAALAQKPARAN